MPAGRRQTRDPIGKITALRREAHGDLGVAAACLLAAFGAEDFESDAAEARAYVGAILVAEAVHELKNVRRLLTPKDH